MNEIFDRFDEVDEVLARIVRLPRGERAAAVDSACGGDPELHELVMRVVGEAKNLDHPSTDDLRYQTYEAFGGRVLRALLQASLVTIVELRQELDDLMNRRADPP